ncbi:MAG TPA: LysR family transcriptional regulator [Ottowia sp.]|uniref:LysR family transcriptional regulator n=1 Tax=Ottowia sp. TaxID=1898956 RepID=UPI002C5AD8EB|nr:LysR family transcriptional regulator [Ottowia sp.]HMN22391.1 LysR family transcriptional regulator [Ottowia sp.]
MNITLRQLRAFVAVVRTSSFTEAATRLHITQSALSGLVRQLESELGVELVHRTTRRIELSQVGADFLPLVERILGDLDRALTSIADLKSLNAGQVRIAVPQLIACTLLPESVAAFAELHPKVEVLVTDSEVEAVSSRVLAGDVDLGVGPERAPSPELLARPMLDMQFHAVLPAGHVLAAGPEVRWAELVREPVISLRGQYTRLLRAELLREATGVVLEPVHEVAFMTTAFAMTAAGLGVTTGMPYAQPLIEQLGLQMRPLVEPAIRRRFYLYSRAGRELGPAAQRFADFLLARAARRGWNALAADAIRNARKRA